MPSKQKKKANEASKKVCETTVYIIPTLLIYIN